MGSRRVQDGVVPLLAELETEDVVSETRPTRWSSVSTSTLVKVASGLGIVLLVVGSVALLSGGGKENKPDVGPIPPMADNLCYKSQANKPPFPYCDIKLSLDERVADLVSRLTLEEKASLLGNSAAAVKSQHLPAYQWWNEALHGVANSPGVNFKGKLKNATMFPQVQVTSQSFNKTLFGLLGSAISTESRAFFNAGQSGLTFWTPNINIFRDPRWGRGQETPGEDPTLNGDYAEHFVQNFQKSPLDPSRLKASACCKHFAAYNLEVVEGEYNRLHFDAIVSNRDMQESYLPMFKACVERGNVSSLMCSYNAINGVPSCANQELLESTARNEWGFDGYITGDCGAVSQVFDNYHFKNHSRSQVIQDVLSASVDVACDDSLKLHTVEAVRSGVTDEKLVDRSLHNLFKVQMRLGMFDPESEQPLAKIGLDAVNSPQHLALSLEAARQGMVLLKNDNGALPLSKPGADDDLALIGPWVNEIDGLAGNYFGVPPFTITLPDGVSPQFAPKSNVIVAKGVENITATGKQLNEALIAQAERIAASASQTILACGIGQKVEAESLDRTSVLLTGDQAELIRRVGSAATKAGKPPVILVLHSGGSLDISEQLADANVGAILWGGYAGMYGGQVVAETLFGVNNPSGRLTQTFYPESYTKAVNMTDMRMHPDEASNFPGRTYRFFNESKAVLPFGHGLSYSTFEYTVVGKQCLAVAGSDENAEQGETCEFTVNVQNIGESAGANVLLALVSPPERAIRQGQHGDLQHKLVSYFKSPILQPGESASTKIMISPSTHLTVFQSGSDTVPKQIYSSTRQTSLSDDQRWTLELRGAHAPLFQQI